MTTLSDLEFQNSTINVSPDDPDVERMPRLCRFYGLSFQELWRLPRWLLIKFDEQIAEITAREQLLAMQVADWPHMETRARKRLHRDMLKFAGMQEEAPVAAPTKPQDIKTIKGMGIGVVFEEPKVKSDA